LEQAYHCVAGLRQHGLFDPSNLAVWDQPEIAHQLRLAGYERGEFMTNLFALRLMALGVYVGQLGIEASKGVISGRDRASIEEFLTPVKGIGPKVLQNFFLLRRI
jgi:hypothetical protein